MAHSCGTYSLDDLFSGARAGVLELAREYVKILAALGDVQVLPQRTRLTCVARVRFAGLYPRKDGFNVNFALQRWLDSPRVTKKIDYGPRWRMHYVLVRRPEDLDDELRGWLRESYETVGTRE